MPGDDSLFVLEGIEKFFKRGSGIADLEKLLFEGFACRGLEVEFVGVDG